MRELVYAKNRQMHNCNAQMVKGIITINNVRGNYALCCVFQ